MKIVGPFLFVAMFLSVIYLGVNDDNQRMDSYLNRKPTCDGQAHRLDFHGGVVETPGPVFNQWLELNPDVVILETTLPHWDMDPLRIKYRCQ